MSTLKEIRAERPGEVGIAWIVALAAALVWAPIGGMLYHEPTLVNVLLLCYAYSAFGAAKGREAARVMMVVTVGLLYVMLAPYCWMGLRDSSLYGPEYAIMDLVAVVLAAIGLVLLYRPNSNRYFYRVTVARRRP